MSDIMVDLETLGTNPNSVILSIGAVRFSRNERNEKYENNFYERISIDSCIEKKLDIDSTTMEWWKLQKEDVRYEALENPDRKPLKQVLTEFSKWFGSETNKIWGKGPSFDCSILANAYRKCDMEPPWKFWNERDVRTIMDLGNIKSYHLPNNQMHHPIADCKRQIIGVKKVFGSY